MEMNATVDFRRFGPVEETISGITLHKVEFAYLASPLRLVIVFSLFLKAIPENQFLKSRRAKIESN